VLMYWHSLHSMEVQHIMDL